MAIGKTLISIVVFLYVVAVIIHLMNGLGFGSALTGPFVTVNLAFNCPQKGLLIWDFANRDSLTDIAVRKAMQFTGGEALTELCEFSRLDEAL